MANRNFTTDVTVDGVVEATTVQEGGVPVVVSGDVDDVIEISQSAYDALGGGRPGGRLYLITS